MDNSKGVQKLRDLAEFFEQHPQLPMPTGFDLVVATKEELITAARLPGARKDYDDLYFYVHVPIAKDHILNFFCSRETVCRPIKTVEKVVPAQPERIVQEVVEWECHPLLKPDADSKPRSEEVLF